MKRFYSILVLFLLTATLIAADASYKEGQVLYVSVKTAKAGKVNFEYGDKVIVEQCNGKKILVHLQNDESVSGWISSGSVTKKKILKTSSGSNVRASTDELALAGKGFSETAENLFKAENPSVDFTIIDEIEKITVDEDTLNEFIKEGHLCEE